MGDPPITPLEFAFVGISFVKHRTGKKVAVFCDQHKSVSTRQRDFVPDIIAPYSSHYHRCLHHTPDSIPILHPLDELTFFRARFTLSSGLVPPSLNCGIVAQDERANVDKSIMAHLIFSIFSPFQNKKANLVWRGNQAIPIIPESGSILSGLTKWTFSVIPPVNSCH